MNTKKLLLVLTIAFTVLLSGCSMDKAYEPGEYYGDDYSNNDTDPEAPAEEIVVPEIEGGDVVNSAAIPALLNRKIIYTASMAMTAEEPVVVYNSVIEDLDTYGAYVESANISQSRYVLKIRVLSTNFSDFVEEIKTTGDLVTFNKTSEDVTNAYSTFEAKKLALETQHARILELIEEATNLSVILTLEDARFEIEAELNQIGSTLANYDSLVDYSTINLTITKVTEAVVVLPTTSSPSVYVVETTKKTAEVQVTNQDDKAAVIYLDVIKNGEFVKQYEGEAFPDGTITFEISDLKSDTDYKFKVTAISAEENESNAVYRNTQTESTFFNKVGNVFEGSFDVLVAILQFIGLAIVAVSPFAVAFAIVFIPGRILYIKFGKEYLKNRKVKKQQLFAQRNKERIHREEELNLIRYKKQKELREKHLKDNPKT